MNKPPAFQFYAGDFLEGTGDMTPTETGVYITLLCYAWNKGGLPKDESRLFLMARTNNEAINEAAVRHVVSEKFNEGPDGLLYNDRLEKVRADQAQYRAIGSTGGKTSAVKRVADSEWGKRMAALRSAQRSDNEATTKRDNEATTNTPTPSPSPSPVASPPLSVEAGRPSLEEVKAHADRIGLVHWRAEDWFNEMEGCGWLDNKSRPVAKWQPLLVRVKNFWEADGRPMQRPSFNGKGENGNNGRIAEKRVDRSIGTANEGIAHEYEGLGNMVQIG